MRNLEDTFLLLDALEADRDELLARGATVCVEIGCVADNDLRPADFILNQHVLIIKLRVWMRLRVSRTITWKIQCTWAQAIVFVRPLSDEPIGSGTVNLCTDLNPVALKASQVTSNRNSVRASAGSKLQRS